MSESQRPILTIGVVAEIIGVSVQTLRLWEVKGLVMPARKGKDRYYSEEDLSRLKHVKYLLHEKKLNTYGVREVLIKEGYSVGETSEEKLDALWEEEGKPPEPSGEGKTILIIDDDPDHLNILRTIVERNGYKAVTAATGRDGLAKIETQTPDLLILDIMIPDMDGLEICRKVKKNKVTASVPVIMVSSMPENIREKFGIGELPGDAFVQKPVRPSEILKEIENLI